MHQPLSAPGAFAPYASSSRFLLCMKLTVTAARRPRPATVKITVPIPPVFGKEDVYLFIMVTVGEFPLPAWTVSLPGLPSHLYSTVQLSRTPVVSSNFGVSVIFTSASSLLYPLGASVSFNQ